MPCTVVFYVLIEMFVDQSKSLERRGVKMGGNLCEDFLRDSKKFILSAILELGTGDRLRSGFLKHCSFPGNLVGAIKHKTGEILGVRRATQTQSGYALAARMDGFQNTFVFGSDSYRY